MNEGILRAIKFGVVCCPVGIFVGIMVLIDSNGNWSTFPFYSTFAAFIAPAVVWYLILEQKKIFTTVRGVYAGCIGAVTAHFACWYSILLVADITSYLKLNPLGGERIGPIMGLEGGFYLALFSFIFFGWLTIPMGGYIGGAFAQKIRKVKSVDPEHITSV